jgi:glycosyltransferase involved in cell wall biosynthesis
MGPRPDGGRVRQETPIPDKNITVSVVMPTYNQRERTRRAAAEAASFLATLPGETPELVVVDDGSRPGAATQASDLPEGTVFVPLKENLGKGGALREGVARARGEYIVVTDSDLPFSLSPLPTTLAWLRGDADIVIGDRLLPESEYHVTVTPARRLSSAVYTFMVKRLCGLDLDDTQCGYKGYRGPIAKELFSQLRTTSFAFEVELLIYAGRAGYRVRRQPLRLVHDDDSSVRLSQHAPRMIMDTLRIAWRARR